MLSYNDLPLEDEIEPVPNDAHPDELDAHSPAQVKPDGKEEEESCVQISHRGGKFKPTLIRLVLRLEVNR